MSEIASDPLVGRSSRINLGYQGQHATPSGTVTVSTTFDALGRPTTVTNPFYSTSDSTYGITQNQYDALDRVTQTTKQDGSYSTVVYNIVPVLAIAGDCTQTTDEAGKQRRACSDGLGRLVEVDEPNPSVAATWATASVTINGSEQSNPQPGAPGTGTVTVSGAEGQGSNQICTDPLPPRQPVCHTVTTWDYGAITVAVNGYSKSANYAQGSTTNTLASALASAFQNDPSSPVNAVASGASVTFTARTIGAATNYTVTKSAASGDSNDFGGGSFSFTADSANALSNGRDSSTNPDSGTVTITVNGTAYPTSYGGSDTNATIATRLAALISAGSWANASAAGGAVTLTSKSTGPGGDYSLAAAATYDSAHFGHPSFTAAASGSGLTGGYNASAVDNNPYVTLYQYDVLGNMLRVDQKGSAPTDSSQWRTRLFTYNSLSQLLTANNPESGTISYVYDAAGNVLQKTSPAPNQTGAATQTVSYCYDELHRVKGRGYGTQSCPLSAPVVTYTYDQGANGKGRMTSLTDQAGTGSYSYDALGRVSSEQRTIAGLSKTMSYGYNLDSSIARVNYPSGAIMAYAPDSAGRTLSVVDIYPVISSTPCNGCPAPPPINYATNATYGPDGQLTGFISGQNGSFAGITNAFSYNKRLQPVNMSASAPGQTVFSIGYDFHLGNGNNGNVWGITNYKDNSRNQNFTYDALNRLTSAQNAGMDCSKTTVNGKTKFWGNNYGYDAWGNLLSKTVAKCSGENLSVTALANNQLSGYSYDAAGNMIHDATSGLNYSYDQENRITGAGGFTYTYDDGGNRVKKSNGSTGTIYWYMTPGIVGESDLTGALKSEYVFFGGERVARKDFPSSAVSYYFSDHLKTASVITDSAGVIKSESDYYPWGGELQFLANDSNHYKFTGKERDAESGLDYFGARYYSNGLGRFISADWSATPVPVPYADFGNPQTLNLYRYPSNPETYADPDGHCDWCQRLKNAISGDGWKTNAELTEEHRQQMIKDFTSEKVKEQLKTMKPEEVDKFWDCAHSPECRGMTLAAQAAAAKPVNLPAYKDVTIDMDHVRSGHTEGGNRLSPKKDVFPKGMSDKAIESAIREAYKNGSKLVTQGERVLVEGKSGSLTIQMWVNKATKVIETAWPKY